MQYPVASTSRVQLPSAPKTHEQSTLDAHVQITAAHLRNLNAAQLEATQHDPRGALQILAGPGSGKTRCLTSRVAHLVRECNLDPKRLIVCTFTNKAANEMKTRLRSLLGEELAGKISASTFHSLCVKYLRKHAALIDLSPNWVIANHNDCQAIVRRLTSQTTEAFATTSKGEKWEAPKHGAVFSIISKAKSRNQNPDSYLAAERAVHQTNEGDLATKMAEFVHEVWTDYDEALRKDNALDFDDLLTYTERLLRQHPQTVASIQHVLVDEFQDTNTVQVRGVALPHLRTQYELVKHLARASGALTIVGDPDQSIYGWRSAEVENLAHMKRDFAHTKAVYLEENYRSTGRILAAALAVVQQGACRFIDRLTHTDKTRIDKSLYTSHPAGQSVVLRKFTDSKSEAAYIAAEIKRLIAHTGGLLTLNDFAILVRFNALSRSIEAGLQAASLPCRIVGGSKFFDRAEVRDILAYLQVADNPSYTSAFRRIVNVPRRGIGEKTIEAIIDAAELKSITPFDVVARAVKGSGFGKLKPAQKKALKPFVRCIEHVRKMASSQQSVADMITYIVEAIEYTGHLERTHGPDAPSRTENVIELKSYAAMVAEEHGQVAEPVEAPIALPMLDDEDDDDDAAMFIDDDDDDDEAPATSQSVALEETPLRTFLELSMLSTDTETEEAKDEKNKQRVTISTCHAAKGLEWPVVFIPAAEDGTFPFYRATEANEHNEENRLLYVAMTRAQSSLYLTHVNARMSGHSTKLEQKQISPFLKPLGQINPIPYSGQPDHLDAAARDLLARVLRRKTVDEAAVAKMIAEHYATMPKQDFSSQPSSLPNFAFNGYNARPASQFTTSRYQSPVFSGSQASGSGSGPTPAPANSGFSSARSALQPNKPMSGLPPVNSGTQGVRIVAAETRVSVTGKGAILNAQLPEQSKPIGLSTFTSASNSTLSMLKGFAAEERAAPSSAAPSRPPSKAFVMPMKRANSTRDDPAKKPKQ